jgi:ADP-L-glycero-D-manno-heptose 6-epimerase
MKILVTGHKGFIGTNMVWFLTERGHEVTTYDWDDGVLAINPVDQVIHLGAIADMTETDTEKVLRQNLDFSIYLFQECNRLGINLQYASSSSVYGNTKNFAEDSACSPQTPYAWSKYLFDRWLSTQQKRIIVQGFRYFNVYGPHMGLRGRRASAIYKWIKQGQENGFIEVWEDADQIYRDWTHVSDICLLHERFFNIRDSGVWNVGPGRAYSFREIAESIADKYGFDVITHKMPQEEAPRFRQITCANLLNLNKTVGYISWRDVKDYIRFDCSV